MGAGRLDREITIRQTTPSQSATGEVSDTPSDLATVWARKDEKAGKEYFAQSGQIAEAARVYRIRYRSDLTTDYKIVDGSNTFEIIDLMEVGRGKYLDIVCKGFVA